MCSVVQWGVQIFNYIWQKCSRCLFFCQESNLVTLSRRVNLMLGMSPYTHLLIITKTKTKSSNYFLRILFAKLPTLHIIIWRCVTSSLIVSASVLWSQCIALESVMWSFNEWGLLRWPHLTSRMNFRASVWNVALLNQNLWIN